MKQINKLIVLALLTLTATSFSKEAHHPDFVRLLANPKAYTKSTIGFGIKSICGENNLVHVSEYDGSKLLPVSFVTKNETSVAALAYGTVPNTTKYCTGTMISEDLFITAAHCVDGGITSEYAVFNYQKKKGSTDLEQPEHFKFTEVVEKSLGGLDYAILRVEGSPGVKYGFKRPSIAEVRQGDVLTVIQHPSGNPKMVDMGHRYGNRGSYMTYGDLDTEPGSSGSGVLDQDGSVVGIHTNGGCYTSGGENAGVPMQEIVKHSKVIQDMTK